MKISIVSAYQINSDATRRKSALYYISIGLIIWLVISMITDIYITNVPMRLVDVWLYLPLIPIVLLLIAIIVTRIHGLLFIIAIVSSLRYEESTIGRAIEKYVSKIWPRKTTQLARYIESSRYMSKGSKQKQEAIIFETMPGIYRGIIFVGFSILIPCIWIVAKIYPYIFTSLYKYIQ